MSSKYSKLVLLACTALVFIANRSFAEDTEEEIDSIRSNFFKQAGEAREEYRNDLRRHARIAVGKLEKIAILAIRQGDLPAATKAYRQVLWLDRENRKAVAHFKTIGTLDKVLKELEDEPALPTGSSGGDSAAGNNKLARVIAGSTWSWGEGKQISFGNNTATASNDPRPNTRVWYPMPDGTIHILTTDPLQYYAILKFDKSISRYEAKTYRLLNVELAGTRQR